MENQSYSRAQKAETNRSIIFIEDDCPLPVEEILSNTKYEVTKNKSEASHTLKYQNGRLFLLNDSSSMNLFSSGLPCNRSNLLALLKLIESHLGEVSPSEEKTNLLKKNLTNQQRRLLKNINKKHLHPSGFEDVCKLTDEIREIDDFYSHFDSLHTLPRSIIEMDLFNGFESSQLIVHQKGKMFCDTYVYQSGVGEQHKIIPVEGFNTIFSLVKKSKSKKFNQSSLLKDDLGVLGTFMANVFSIKNHDIVFIVSQNGFLPPTKSEIGLFDKFCSRMGSVFNFLLERNQVSEKSQNINIFLMNYPYAAAILTNKDQILFKNRLFDEETFYDYINFPEKFISWKLIKDHQLLIKKPDTAKNISDIYHYQRVSLLGELLNTLQHELSNPLFGLKLTADLLEGEQDDSEVAETLSDIANNCSRCQGIIRNFSYLYQDESFTDHVEVHSLVKETLTLTKSESRQILKEINKHNLPEDFTIETNPTWLSQVLFNLIVNSSQAIKTLGDDFKSHKIIIDLVHNSDAKELEISVSDSGPGIPEVNKENIFTPFYTTKDKGTGLGLSICNNLCHKLGGRLNHGKSKLGGAKFTLIIPLARIES
ncbi:MAG: HAMP domain-containing histidine kinase [Bacteriovoracaceae bacterium]|nr:HAMP domain-containing histidine kinase [Bacteriovoracaceae bacterium]